MKRELILDKQQSEHNTNLLIDGVLDSRIKYKEDVFQAVHLKLTKKKTHQNPHIQDQANRILEEATNIPVAHDAYTEIKDGIIKLTHAPEVRMPIFQLKKGGSSDDEVDPITYETDDIISIAQGAPRDIQFYVIGRIKYKKNDLVPKVEVKKSFKGAKQPKIYIEKQFGQYFIYRVIVSSFTQSFIIYCNCKKTSDDFILRSSILKINDIMKLKNGLNLMDCFCFDFQNLKLGHISLFEKIMIYSMHGKTAKLMEEQNMKFDKMRDQDIFIDDQLTSIMCSSEKVDYCYHILVQLLGQWNIANRQQTVGVKVLELLGRIFLADVEPPFVEQKQTETNRRKQFLSSILDMIVHSNTHKIFEREVPKIVEKLLRVIEQKYQDYSGLQILTKINMLSCPALRTYAQKPNYYISKYVQPFITKQSDLIAAHINLISYNLKFQPSQFNVRFVQGLRQISIIATKPSIQESYYLTISKNQINEMMGQLKISELNIHLFKDFLLCLPLIRKLQRFIGQQNKGLRKDIHKRLANLEIKAKDKDKKIKLLCIEILKIACIQNQVYNQIKRICIQIDETFEGKCIELVKAFDEQVYKKINKELILNLIKNKREITRNVKKIFMDNLQKQPRKEKSLAILNQGLTDQFFQLQNHQIKFNELLISIIDKMELKNAREPQWKNFFIYHKHINVKILEILLEQKRKSLKQIDFDQFFNQISWFITDSSSNLSEKDRDTLLIILKKQKMELDQVSIMHYLKDKEKIYLKILLMFKKGTDEKKRKTTQSLEKIGKMIEGQELSYQELNQIIPTTEKDKDRLSELLPRDTYRKLLQQRQNCYKKISRLRQVTTFLIAIQKKFQINENEVEEMKIRINQSIKSIEKLKVKQIDKVQKFNEIKDDHLSLYPFKFYFKDISVKEKIGLKRVIEILSDRNKQIRTKLSKFLDELKDDKLVIQQFQFFNFQSLSKEQINQILSIVSFSSEGEVSYTDKIVEVIKKIKIIYINKSISLALLRFLQPRKDCQDIKNEIKKNVEFDSKFKSPSISISYVEHLIKNNADILQKLNIYYGTETETKIKNSSFTFQSLYEIIFDEQNELFKLFSSEKLVQISILVSINEHFEKLKKLQAYTKSIQQMKQMVLNSSDGLCSLKSSDFHNFTTVISFFETCVIKNKDNVKYLELILISIKQFKEGPKSLIRKIVSLVSLANQFQNTYQELKNPTHGQAVGIKNIVENSYVEIGFKSSDYLYSIDIFSKKTGRIASESRIQSVAFFQLEKYRDEALMRKNKLESESGEKDKQSIIRISNTFIALYGLLMKIKQNISSSIDNGILLFNDQKIKIDIIDHSLKQLEQYENKTKERLQKWKIGLQTISSLSNKITLLGGSKLREFYQLLIGSHPNKINQYRYIAKSAEIQKFIAKKLKRETDPFKCLETIQQFFRDLKTAIKAKPAADRDQTYLQLFRFPQQLNRDYIVCLNEMRSEKLSSVQEGFILSCKKDSTILDVESFIDRASLDPDHQYVILGYDNLSEQLQKIAVNKLETNSASGKNQLKLCVVGKQANHPIYRYMKTRMNITKSLQGEKLSDLKPQFKDFIKNKVDNQKGGWGISRIVTSSYHGLGKTFYVCQEAAKAKQKVIYYPISGRTFSAKLFDRLEEKIKKQGGEYCILIQVYEIEKQDRSIVNDFIRQLIILKSYEHNKKLCVLKSKSRIYVELQDQQDLKHFPILGYMKQNFKQTHIHIPEFKIDGLKFGKDKLHKLKFILEHLRMFDGQTLDTTDFGKCNINFDQVNVNFQLLEKYFIMPCRSLLGNKCQLTFYLLSYWVDLFFNSCTAFSNTYQISNQFFTRDYQPSFIKKYQLQKVRSEFFKVLHQNSIQFLTFSIQDINNVKARGGDSQSSLNFFIVPNNGFNWFSFIYKKTEHIPAAIRQYYLSQAVIYPGNSNKSVAELEKIVFQQRQMEKLELSNKAKFQEKLQQILRDISGNNSYKLENDPNYVLNLDNFMKICLIAYKMRVNIPLVIQGQAGVGKTALLRHTIEEIFKYKFISHTVNAGLTQKELQQKIDKAIKQYTENKMQNSQFQQKVCLFLDQFNTLPQLGYIKQIMMEGRFQGEEKKNIQNIVIFAACNPHRINNPQLNPQTLAFTVKRPPLSIGQIIWNFGSLTEEQMNKYVKSMIYVVKEDLPEYNFIQIICQFQKVLNEIRFGSTSLRDVERFRQIYVWLKQKLPMQSKIPLSKNIQVYYEQKNLRAFILSFMICYFSKINHQVALPQIQNLKKKFPKNVSYDIMKEIKRFEEDDFSSRLRIPFDGIALNSALKQNLFSTFICLMKCIPILIIGNPGSSKSMAVRIIIENFKESNENEKQKIDSWLRQFPKVFEFFFQGSENCTTASIQKRFKAILNYNNHQNDRKVKTIPLFFFDQIGLAEKSLDNPLKAIHEPLEITVKKKSGNKKNESGRDLAFIGISNHELDLSKMSRFLIIRRPDLSLQDLKATSIGISGQILKQDKFNLASIQQYLSSFSDTYIEFLNLWRSAKDRSDSIKNFFGLRDYYSLVRTFADFIKKNKRNNPKQQDLNWMSSIAIYRNFNGFSDSYTTFTNIFFKKMGKMYKQIECNPMNETLESLAHEGRRYPLVIVQSNIVKSIFVNKVNSKFKNCSIVWGSSFRQDQRKSEYITKNITQIMKIVESDSIMVTKCLNKAAEGALFDLFNKFFTKRQGFDLYRVAIQQSGFSTTGIVHKKFNTCIVVDSDDIVKESSAFLNRFEKYEITLASVLSDKNRQIVSRITEVEAKILDFCKANELSHYSIQYLFFNFSEHSKISLAQKLILKSEAFNVQTILNEAIDKMGQLATKDMEYLIDMILKAELSDADKNIFERLKESISNKKAAMDDSKNIIIITTDQSFWSTGLKRKQIISLQLFKTQSSLKQQIKAFLADCDNERDPTLFIDFSRECEAPYSNMNDKQVYMKQNQKRVEVGYVINLIEECMSDILKFDRNKVINPKLKIRMILNYNRNKKYRDRFEPLSFMEKYQIFSNDGSSTEEKKKMFGQVNIEKVFKQCLTKFNFKLDGFEDEKREKQIVQLMKKELSKSEQFRQVCEKVITDLTKNSDQEITDENKEQALKNRANLEDYNSIVTVITKQIFSKKFSAPIIFFIKSVAEDNSVFAYTPKANLEIQKQFYRIDERFDGNLDEKMMKDFLVIMGYKKVEKLKATRRQNFNIPEEPYEITLKRPSFMPYSQIQIDLLFSEENVMIPKDKGFDDQFKIFEEQHINKMKSKFGKPQLYQHYNKLTKLEGYCQSLLTVDLLSKVLEKVKLPMINTIYIKNSLKNMIFHKANSLLKIFYFMLVHTEVWGSVLKIVNQMVEANITKGLDRLKDYDINQVIINVLCFSSKMLALTQPSISGIKGENFQYKLKLYSDLHHSVFSELDHLKKNGAFNQNDHRYEAMRITDEFIVVMEYINLKLPNSPIIQVLKSIELKKDAYTDEKEMEKFKMQLIIKIKEYLTKCRDYGEVSKFADEYLANKLFPSWFNFCGDEKKLTEFTKQFIGLCSSQNLTFVHNSTTSLQIAIKSLQISFKENQIKQTLGRLEILSGKRHSLPLKKKFLFEIGQKCKSASYNNNLSILLCNMFYLNMRRAEIEMKLKFDQGYLTRNFNQFSEAIKKITENQHSCLVIFSFAFVKLYLMHFIQSGRPQYKICNQIDKVLCFEDGLRKNLRMYCLKILRKRFNAKQISDRYIKIKTYRWCQFMVEQMKESQSRAIEIPKTSQFKQALLEEKIYQFKQSQGKDVNYLDQIVEIGSKNPVSRYVVLNFFMSYIYTLAYNKQYQSQVISHVKSKEKEYRQKMGDAQYNLILRYTMSNFDENYSVTTHDSFNQDHLITLNSINWLYASKQSASPIHSLFFKPKESIGKQISQSFLPCGPQNNYILIAKQIQKDTRNSNIGVYICSNQCDFMYSHLNCGWPNQSKPCDACGEQIGSGGGHRLARTDKGARRVISTMVLDNSRFYVGSLKALQQYWEAQRFYIRAQINRMRMKNEVILKPEINKKREIVKKSLLGYDLKFSAENTAGQNRISLNSCKVLMYCFESILYSLVSIDVIKPTDYQPIFGMTQKKAILAKLNEKLKQYIKDLKQVVDLNNRFYTWIFGIQSEIFEFLINFKSNFSQYIKGLQIETNALITKMNNKVNSLSNTEYKNLYNDFVRVFQTGYIYKQFKQIESQNAMTARNQFTRQIFEEFIEKLVTQKLFEGKINFVQKHFQPQGKMQFQFDIYLTESKQNINFSYSKILKAPTQILTFEQITRKYESILKDNYPVLHYLVSNNLNFTALRHFSQVVRSSNKIYQSLKAQLSRGYLKQRSLKDYVKIDKQLPINIENFLVAWRELDKFLGPIQVGCKTYGRMNNQFNENTPAYNFLLDDTLKENANGKVMAGIFSNFASLHNQVLNSLKTRKNLINKYQKINFFISDYKISPQKVKLQDCIQISQEKIVNKILEYSVISIRYGQNLLLHNFDFCQAYFLSKLKGICQLEPDTETYVSAEYAGEAFSLGTIGANSNAVSDVREILNQKLAEEEIEKAEGWLNSTEEESERIRKFAQLQKLVKALSESNQDLSEMNVTIKQFLEKHESLSLDELYQIQKFKIQKIVSVYNTAEQHFRKSHEKTIPQKYWQPLQGPLIAELKSFLQTLPREGPSEQFPSVQELLESIKNFAYRNLLSQFLPEEKKIFENILFKEDCWPYGYDMNKNYMVFGTVLKRVEAKNTMKLIELVNGFLR